MARIKAVIGPVNLGFNVHLCTTCTIESFENKSILSCESHDVIIGANLLFEMVFKATKQSQQCAKFSIEVSWLHLAAQKKTFQF